MVRKIKPESLQVVVWNANGLRHKRNDLERFATDVQADILLISETHLRPADNPKLRNFVLYRNDRQNGGGGGTAVYVKNSIDHNEIATPQLERLEVTGIAVHTANAGTLKLYAAYAPPSRLLESDLEEIFDNDGGATVLAGDLNAKHPTWNSRVTNVKGRLLHRFVDQRDMVVLGPEEPTHFGHVGRPDVLDIAVLKDVVHQTRIQVIGGELDSDHDPVILHLGREDEMDPPAEYDKVNWQLFKESLATRVGPVPRIWVKEDIDLAIENLESRVREAKTDATTTVSLRTRRDGLPPDIRDLVRDRNRARRRYRRTLAPVDRADVNRLCAEVRRRLQEYRNSKWCQKLEELTTEDCSLWRMTKVLRNQRKPLPPIHGEDGVVYTDEEKAEAFALNLERQCSPNWEHADPDFVELIERCVERRLNQVRAPEIRPVSPAEVRSMIKKLKVRKAPGPDGISNKMVRQFPDLAVMHLVAIYNGMLRLVHFPEKWKIADVIFLPKGGGAQQFPQNYRPISLLPCMGKMAEKVILWRLKDFEREHDIIPPEQFGFRDGHSTTDQVLRVVEHVTDSFNRKRHTGAVFLDVAKAFDKVWHEGLLHKLLDAGFPIGLVQIIRSYLENRKFRAKIGTTRSTMKDITSGVPQGSILSPFLFAIFMSDVPKPVDADSTTALYADDTAVLVRSGSAETVTRKLQENLDRLEEWFTRWRIEVNAAKSSAVLFTKKRTRDNRVIDPDGEVFMFDTPIPWRSEAKYLGVTLDRGMTCKTHTTGVRNKAYGIISQIYSMIGRRSRLSIGNKLLMYKTIVRPVMMYASPAWGHAAATHIRRLQRVQNKFLRIALNAPWFVRNTQLHEEAKMPSLKDFMLATAEKYFQRAAQHRNPLVRVAVDYDEQIHHKHKRPKMALVR